MRICLLFETGGVFLSPAGPVLHTIFDEMHKFGYQWRNVYREQPLSGDQFDILCEPI
jgi:hypothetical protein